MRASLARIPITQLSVKETTASPSSRIDCSMISIFGSSEMRWVESLIAAVVMTAFCVALFVYLLQLPFQLWPWY